MTDLKDLWKIKAWRVQFIVVALLSTVIGLLVYWANDVTPPYQYNAAESFIVPDPADGGDQVIVKWKVLPPVRLCAGSVRRVLFDPKTKVILAVYDPSPAAISGSLQDGYLNRTFTLPKVIQCGHTGYRAEVKYQCNWLQRTLPDLFAFPVTTPDLFFNIACK